MSNIKLMVCPHDTAKNPENWYNFAQYLTQTITNSVMFEKSIDFPDFHEKLTTGGLVYANPQDSVKLIKEHNYLPVARPSNLFDEIVFVANKNMVEASLTDLSNKPITTVESMMVSKVGLKYLLNQNIIPSEIHSTESWMAAIKSIFRNETSYAMIYKDFFDGLNKLSKSGLVKIGETTGGTIHHNLLTSPELADLSPHIQQCLLQMHENNKRSSEILASLNIDKFENTTKDDILNFDLLNTYSLNNAVKVSKTAATV